jgi:hypothetical protein
MCESRHQAPLGCSKFIRPLLVAVALLALSRGIGM